MDLESKSSLPIAAWSKMRTTKNQGSEEPQLLGTNYIGALSMVSTAYSIP